MTLGKSPSLNVRVEPQPGQDPALLAADLGRALGSLRVLLLLAPDAAGEKEALSSASVSAENGAVIVRAPWPYEGLDRACEQLARALRQRDER
jgi:hypothetical protein